MQGENENEKDSPQNAGQTSEKNVSTSAKSVAYTEEQIAKIKSDAAAEAGRRRKAAEVERDELRNQFDDLRGRLEQMEKEKEEAMFNAVKDDPTKAKLFQEQQNLRLRSRKIEEIEKELKKKESELQESIRTINEERFASKVDILSNRYDMSVDEIMELGITDPTVLEKVVKRIALSAKKEEAEEEESFIADSGRSVGGNMVLNNKNIEKMSVKDIKKALYGENK